MSTKPLLVLLDADVIIELHKVGAWDGVLTAYNVEVSEIIARQEVQFYYDSTGKRVYTNPITFLRKAIQSDHSKSIC